MTIPLQWVCRYDQSPAPRSTCSTHTNTGISNTSEYLFLEVGAKKEIFQIPPSQIKWSLTKHCEGQVQRGTDRSQEQKNPCHTKAHHPVSDSEWGVPPYPSHTLPITAPKHQDLSPRGPYRREHPNYYPGKLGWDKCNLLVLNISAFRKLYKLTNSPSHHTPLGPESGWKLLFQIKDVIKSMPWTSPIFRIVALVLIQFSFTLTLYTILNIHEIWSLSPQTTISNNLEIT